MKRSIPLARAQRFADAVLDELAPACERIIIAGSIRRKVPTVGDVELVAVPRGAPRDLLGDRTTGPNDLDRLVDALVERGRLRLRRDEDGRTRAGPRFKALESSGGEIALDLFVVLPPASWGAIVAIRTGPADFARRLVTSALERQRRVRGGHVEAEGEQVIPTPEERDFFREVGIPWVDPARRFG